MEITDFSINVPLNLYQIEEWKDAVLMAESTNQIVYSYKTIGRSNWFEKGLSISDVMGLVVLPNGLPDVIDLPDDPAEGKYLIDIELSGLIAVEADSQEDAIEIAEQIGTDKLKDSLLNARARLVKELKPAEGGEITCFSESDI